MATVADLMTAPPPTLPPEATLATVAAYLAIDSQPMVLVAEPAGGVRMVTAGDVVRALGRGCVPETPLAALTESPPARIDATAGVDAAVAALRAHGSDHLLVTGDAGEPLGIVSFAQLHTHLARHCDRQARFQQVLFDHLPFVVWLKDTDSRLLAANRAMAELAGLEDHRLLSGLRDDDLWPHELAARYRVDDQNVMDTRQPRMVTETFSRHGQSACYEVWKAPVEDAAGQVLGTVGFARDVTAKKRADEALLIRNAALAGLLRGERLEGTLELLVLAVECEQPQVHCAVLLAREAGDWLRLAAAPSLSDYGRAILDGMAVAENAGLAGTTAFRRVPVCIEDFSAVTHSQRLPAFARETGLNAGWAEPIIDADGELLGVFAAYYANRQQLAASNKEPVAEAARLAGMLIAHQRTATRLEKSLATFRGIFDHIGEALLILTPDGAYLDVNQAAERLCGRSRETLCRARLGDFGSAGRNDPAPLQAAIARAASGETAHLDYWAERPSGEVYPVHITLNPGTYFGQPALIASAHDISAHKRTELLLEIERDLSLAADTETERPRLLATCLQLALRLPGIDSGALYSRDTAAGSLALISAAGLADDLTDRLGALIHRHGADRRLCACHPGRGCCTGPTLLQDASLGDTPLRSLITLPLRSGPRLLAVLCLTSHRERAFPDDLDDTLDRLQALFGQTLQRFDALSEARRMQANLHGLFDTIGDFIFILDTDNRIQHCNRAVRDILGYDPATLAGQPIARLHPPGTLDRLPARASDMIARQASECPLPMLTADGRQIMVNTRLALGFWNTRPAIICVAQDIGERLQAEERQRLAASVFDHAHEGIMITDAEGRIVEINATFSELTGYSRDEALGQKADLLKSGHHSAAFYAEMWQTIRDTGFWRGEVWNRKKSGELFAERLTISTVRTPEGEITHFVGIFSDITLIKEHEQRLEHLAHFDALTQLPNRMLLGDRLETAMAQCGRHNQSIAVCYLDLDGFKPVNDTWGHATGDRLLVEVARRLRQCVRAGDTVSRLGGDEFVLLVTGLHNLEECEHALGRTLTSLCQPFVVDGHDIRISASIGVTRYPQDNADADALLRHADQAMYAAKQAGRNRFHLFDPEHDRQHQARQEEIARIADGLAAGEFVLHFQPKVDMRRGEVIGAEALIRWQHPEDGLLAPARFLPVLAGSPILVDLGDWVLRQALHHLEAWHAAGLRLSVSVNIDGIHLQAPGFVPRLAELLAQHPAVPPDALELEILETAALDDMDRVAGVFTECRALGVHFSLDDFGTGYSSLTYFRRLPAQTLKIDQSFVRNMLDDANDLAIVEGVIGLTRAFERQVIAEGVETVEHGLVLLLLGCPFAQGYGIARPMPADQLPAWIRGFRPDPLWDIASSFRWTRDDLPMLIAEVDHRRWKAALDAWLDDDTGTRHPPTDSPRECRFGRWYYGPQAGRYRDNPVFGEIEHHHDTFHRLGDQVTECRRNHQTAALPGLRSELDAASTRLAECLQQLQADTILRRAIR